MDILTCCKNESYHLLFEIQEKRKEIDRRARKIKRSLKRLSENPEKIEEIASKLAMERTCDFLASLEKFRISIIERYSKLLEKILIHDLPVGDFPLRELADYINPPVGHL